MLMTQWNIPQRYQAIGLLFATFVTGYVSMIINTDIPIGFMLQMNGIADLWVDEMLVDYIYIPQHIFSIIYLLCAWLVFASQSPNIRSRIFLSFLLTSAALSSYIFFPITLLFLGVILISDFLTISERKKRTSISAASLLIFLFLACPLLWQASQWMGGTNFLSTSPLSFQGWLYTILSAGFIVILAFFLFLIVKLTTQQLSVILP